MAVFRCKMCGAVLQINGETVAECEYCGVQQTLPRLDDEKREQMYDRANHFRRNNEFDKATAIYELILNEDNTDAEAYWSLVLCRYGIEYVEDPTTNKRIPTVNRAQFTSVFDDDNYKSAINYADLHQKAIYQNEASAINEIQKGILAISEKEEPFDVFICYKETDLNGQRTLDSVLATELYNELNREGLKVFFSRITLEDKLGTAYEPYIFAALNSAKVMVVIGTKYEHFNAVWVKNEWSRYLALIKNGARKSLIPAYKDMNPYDLPQEFSHLQAQDMSKLGFMQDLVRGIKKIVDAQSQKVAPVKETIVNGGNVNIESLLKRIFMFLEDGEWNPASEYCEKVLDIDPECAEAYLGKMMVSLHVRKQEDLKNLSHPFDGNNNYKKAIRFADEKLKNTLNEYLDFIKIRNENERLDNIYNQARTIMLSAQSEYQYKEAAKKFESIAEYMDSELLAQECYNKAEIARIEHKRILETLIQEKNKRSKRNKIITFIIALIIVIIAFIIILNSIIIPNSRYNTAVELIQNEKYIEAYQTLIELDEFKDSKKLASDIYDFYKIEKMKFANVGDSVFLGSYRQDTKGKWDEIEWLVLDKKDGRALLISKYALDCRRYHLNHTITSWEKSDIRDWLNYNFIFYAFSDYEQTKIALSTISADKNPKYNDTDPGNATKDKIFLLSVDEFNKYFNSDSVKKCKPTDYAVENGVFENTDGNCCWWLRTPGRDQSRAVYVNNIGDVSEQGNGVALSDYGVRPAMWIDIE